MLRPISLVGPHRVAEAAVRDFARKVFRESVRLPRTRRRCNDLPPTFVGPTCYPASIMARALSVKGVHVATATDPPSLHIQVSQSTMSVGWRSYSGRESRSSLWKMSASGSEPIQTSSRSFGSTYSQ